MAVCQAKGRLERAAGRPFAWQRAAGRNLAKGGWAAAAGFSRADFLHGTDSAIYPGQATSGGGPGAGAIARRPAARAWPPAGSAVPARSATSLLASTRRDYPMGSNKLDRQ